MVNKIKILFVLLLLLSYSCQKAEDRICLKGTGNEITINISVDNNIDSLFLYDNIFYTIIPSSQSKVELTGGKNLLSFIEVGSHAKKLSISNKNKCNFLRSYKPKIYAKIYVDSISYIDYFGSAKLINTDTLHSGEFRIFVSQGAGEVDLTLKNGYTAASIPNGYGNIFLKGTANMAYIHCNSNSYCDAREFKVSDELKVISNGVQDIYINADNVDLEAVIYQSGNIGFLGNPKSINLKNIGNGKLYSLD